MHREKYWTEGLSCPNLPRVNITVITVETRRKTDESADSVAKDVKFIKLLRETRISRLNKNSVYAKGKTKEN